MPQHATPTTLPPEPPLLTKDGLIKWLNTSDWTVRRVYLTDPEFIEKCAVDLTPESSRRNLRFIPHEVLAYLKRKATASKAA